MNNMTDVMENTKANEGKDFPAIYLAVSFKEPTVGEPYVCVTLDRSDNKFDFITTETGTVRDTRRIGENVYLVATCGIVYIVQVFSNGEDLG